MKKDLVLGILFLLIGILVLLLIWIILPSIFHGFPFIISIGAFVFIFYGVRGIVYSSLTHEKRKDYILLNKRKLLKMKNNLKLVGNGSQENPLMITRDTFSISKIFIRDNSFFITIEGINCNHIRLKRCKNARIMDSKIKRISISFCTNLKIINNTIEEIRMNDSIENILINNSLSESGLYLLNKLKNMSKVTLYQKNLGYNLLILFSIIIGCLAFIGLNKLIELSVFLVSLLFLWTIVLYSLARNWFFIKGTMGNPNEIHTNSNHG